MEGIKFIASQAKSIYRYNSIRYKIHMCNADIYFNKQCLTKKIIPKYASIKIPTTSIAAHTTQKKVSLIIIKEEIKFLYTKKEQLNKELYKIHLKVAQEWVNTWHIIQNTIHKHISN
jgi:hypothetical protein